MNENKLHTLTEFKKLLDAGILNETEFAEQKKRILSDDEPGETGNQPEFIKNNDSVIESSSNKKLIWIIVGVVAASAVIAIVLSSNKNNENNSYNGEDSYQDEPISVEEYEEAPYATEEAPAFDPSTVCPYDGIPDDELEDYDSYQYRTDSYDLNSDANAWN